MVNTSLPPTDYSSSFFQHSVHLTFPPKHQQTMSPPVEHLKGTASIDNDKNVMDSLTSEFEALRLALPDPESELFHQSVNKLDTFHPFPKLPLELRTVIWHYAFPRGRKVLIDENTEHKFIGFVGFYKRVRRTPPPPAVFQINKESRAIALSACIQILPSSPNCAAVIYFHLDLDTFVLRDVNAVHGLGVPLAEGDPVLVEKLGKIQSAEIKKSGPAYFGWCHCFLSYLEDSYWWKTPNDADFPIHFKNLRTLVFEWPKNPDPSRKDYKRWLEELRNDLGPALKLWFERKKEATGDYRVPEITFKP